MCAFFLPPLYMCYCGRPQVFLNKMSGALFSSQTSLNRRPKTATPPECYILNRFLFPPRNSHIMRALFRLHRVSCAVYRRSLVEQNALKSSAYSQIFTCSRMVAATRLSRLRALSCRPDIFPPFILGISHKLPILCCNFSVNYNNNLTITFSQSSLS